MISMPAYFIAGKINVEQQNKTKRTLLKYFQGYLGVIINQRAMSGCDTQCFHVKLNKNKKQHFIIRSP